MGIELDYSGNEGVLVDGKGNITFSNDNPVNKQVGQVNIQNYFEGREGGAASIAYVSYLMGQIELKNKTIELLHEKIADLEEYILQSDAEIFKLKKGRKVVEIGEQVFLLEDK